MKNPLIITIGREYGSGGREIGKALAEKLGISFYDKKIISLAAEKSGLSPEFITSNEQRTSGGIMHTMSVSPHYNGGFFSPHHLPLSETIFISQAQVIRDIAAKERAVIVGRCADYILAGRQNTVNIFIHAPKEDRVRRIMELYELSEADALKAIAKSDKERGNHYFRYTDMKWDKAQNYDLCVNSSLLGIEGTVEMLMDVAKIEDRTL
ncbi:MAG: cytidylate kinase-like family protein [Clostridia bacterium]|nr:cytidylate kinase-like family protein [Clostridia bacterium]